ncbi:PASTA domain-containing protein [Prevotella sp. 10(H)]|uniref:PASTA domain-containing protein n=1 Tax=Prevotella sp. 10(H) TaxID=1158294 RepID=UPI0004A76153|nr:PASTA domain-containing protein [Prevotella sp. 10(H)]
MKKNVVLRIITNIYVRNILIMIVIALVMVAIVLFFLNIYTKHDQSVTVPSVKGLQVEEAEGIIKAANLNYEVVDSIFATGGVPGAIIEQTPKEQSKVKDGRTIFLTIQAKGIQMVAIPELKDYSRRQAEAQLNSLGFDKIIIDEVPSAYAGIVISVSYKGKTLTPNQKIPKGSTIHMTVGAGGESLDDSIPDMDMNVDESFFE